MDKPECCKGCNITEYVTDGKDRKQARVCCEHVASGDYAVKHSLDIGMNRLVELCERCWKAVIADVLMELSPKPEPVYQPYCVPSYVPGYWPWG